MTRDKLRRNGLLWFKRIDLPLLGIVTGAAAFIAYWSLQVDQWGLMTDELLYTKLGLNFGLPEVRGEYFAQFTPVYPLLIAPALALFDMPTAFKVAHALNALLLASAAVPAFILARDVSRSRIVGYLVAVTSVVVPWVVYADMLITESAAYPIFLWTIIAILRAVDSPSVRHDVIAIAAIGLATLTRTQFAVLGGVLAAAVLAHELAYKPEWVRRRPRTRALVLSLRDVARRHAVLTAAVGAGAVCLVLLELTGGLNAGAGQYGNTLTGDLLPHGVNWSFRAHLAVVAMNIAVVPLMLAIAFGIAAGIRPESKLEHAFAIVLGLTVITVVLEAASVNVRTIGLIQERYAFYIAPLLLTGALCYAARPRLTWVALPIGAVTTIWVLAKLDYGLAKSYSFVSPFYAVVGNRVHDIGSVFGSEHLTPGRFFQIVVIAAALALIALARRASSGWRIAIVGIPVLVYCAVAANHDFDKLLPGQDSAQARLGLETPLQRERGLDWVDDVLPDGAKAGFTPAVIADIDTTRRAWWDLEFWNKSVARMYDYEPAWRDGAFPVQRMRVDPATGAIAVRDPLRHVVVPRWDRRLGIGGRVIAGTSLLSLLEAQLPLRARWTVTGTDADGWQSAGKPARVRIFPWSTGAPQRAHVEVRLTSSQYHRPRTRFSVVGGERVISGAVRRARSLRVRVPVCVRPGTPSELQVRVPAGAVLPVDRPVGLAVTAVSEKPAGPCASAR